MTKHKPKLKVGQTWRRRDGEIVEIVRKKDNIYFPADCSEGTPYTESGCFWADGRPDPWDLIELITDAPNSEPHP